MAVSPLQPFAAVALIVAVVFGGIHTGAAVDYSSPNKDPRCHMPTTLTCKSSPYKGPNDTVVSWFYFTLFKSCHPLYSEGGVHHCKENMDLPATKEECENLCSEPCKMDNGTEGICMFEYFCKRVNHVNTMGWTPCKAYNVNCCFRPSKQEYADFRLEKSTTTTTTTEEPTKTEPDKSNDVDNMDVKLFTNKYPNFNRKHRTPKPVGRL